MKTLITRADDYASSHAANQAIARAAQAGFVKNISVMAVCPFVEEAAGLLAHKDGLCFGLHIALNSEWDVMRWGPLTNAPSLTDARGCFYQDPAQFAEHPPRLDEVMAEIEAQYARLAGAGFHLSYAECHMLPERYLPGLQQRLAQWIREKGLLDFSFYMDRVLPHMDEVAVTPGLFEKVLSGLGDGQYCYVAHPALYGQEMLQTGNALCSGEEIARHRAADAAFMADPRTLEICRAQGVATIRLDEALPGEYRVFGPGPMLQ